MGTTNYDKLDTSEGYEVNSTEVVDSSGNVSGTVTGTISSPDSLKWEEGSLAAVDTGGGVAAWTNDAGATVIIERLILDVTTAATGACTLDAGTTPTSATTVSDNLIDGLDVNSATGNFDNIGNGGSNGKSVGRIADGDFLTVSVKTGASAGLVGKYYILYRTI